MKTRLLFQLLFASLLIIGISERATGQCFATYSTQNNFCDLDSLYLTVYPGGGTEPYEYEWANGQTTQTISIPLATGNYTVTVTEADGCEVVLVCHIKPGPLVLYYPYNQNACQGDTVLLFLQWYRDSVPGAEYLWSTGETTPTIQITDDITWSVTVTDPSTGCEFIIPPSFFDFHSIPPVNIIGPTMICAGQSVTLTLEGGPFGTIFWFEPETGDGDWGETYSTDHPGMYVVWAGSTEVSYCWNLDTLVIEEGEIEPPLLQGPPELCSGQEGTIEVTNSSEYTEFDWSNGQSTSSILVNQPGTYTVTVTNAGGCTGTASLTIANGSDYDVTVSTDASTCGQSNGSIDLSMSPPGNYTFNWSNGTQDEDIADVLSGSYTVTVTSEGGCTSTITAFIQDNPILITITEIIIPNTSCNDGNGAIDISLQPSGVYTYAWSNGATTEDLINISPGIYTVTVALGENCTATETYTVGNESDVPILVGLGEPASCGQSNGSINLTLDGGQGPFTFIWSNGATTEDLTDIPAGTYTVTVTGANGCAESEIVTVGDDDVVILITADIIAVTSCVESNGSIDLTVNPPGTYTFIWSNGATTEDISNLSEGIYSVEILFGESCTETASFTIEHTGNQVDVQASTTENNSCTFPNGTIDLAITPDGIYTFQWSNGSVTEDLNDLDAGTYSVTITDSENCSTFGTWTIESLLTIPDITAQITPSSCGQSNGAIALTVQPETGNTFLWSHGETLEDITNLFAGVYSVTLTASNGCITIDTFDVPDVASTFSASAVTVANSSCSLADGFIDLTLVPAGTYSFFWSNGNVTEDATQLVSGTYSVTITDVLGCTNTATYTVDDNTMSPAISAIVTPASCGESTGVIEVTAMETGNTYVWSNGITSEDLTDLFPGTYMVTVTGANGCISLDTFSVSNINSNFTLSANILPQSSCINPNGEINLAVVPGGTYQYSWSNGMTTEDLNNLASGTYSVTVTDSLNCAAIETFLVASNTVDPVIASSIDPSTCGQSNGAIDLEVSPVDIYTFLWSNGIELEDVKDLGPGLYSVTVTGSNGCSATASFIIESQSSDFAVSATLTHDNACDLDNGALNLEVAPPGLYTFLWSNGDITEDLQDLGAGVYTVTVTDSLGCSSSETFVIVNEAAAPVISASITPATCGQDNGVIVLTVTPAIGNSYSWSNGSNDSGLQDLSAGIYDVTVTSANGCTASGSFAVMDTGIAFSLNAVSTMHNSCVAPNGSINLSVTPTGSYTYLWSNGATTEDLVNITAGVYRVTVTDYTSCSKDMEITIEDETTTPEVTASTSPETCGAQNGSIDLQVTPSVGNTFMWSNGATTEDQQTLSPGIYSVTVTNAQGCAWSGNFAISGSVMPVVDLGADIIVEYGQEVSLHAQINVPLTTLDTVIWLPGELFSCKEQICLDQTFTPTEQTEVVLMVFDTNGCMAEESIMVSIRSAINPSVFIPNVFSPNGDGANDAFTVFANPDVEEVVDLRIFDRWGEFVFQNEHFSPNALTYGWDGMYRGKLMDPQVFVYWTRVKFKDGTEELYKGDVTLIR